MQGYSLTQPESRNSPFALPLSPTSGGEAQVCCCAAEGATPSDGDRRREGCSGASSHLSPTPYHLTDYDAQLEREERLAIQTEDAPASLDSWQHLRMEGWGEAQHTAGAEAVGISSPCANEEDLHEYMVLQCQTPGCGYWRKIIKRCKDRTCPRCRRKDFYRLFNRYKERVRQTRPHQFKFVTLTIKNREDLASARDELREAFSKLRRQRRYKEAWKGGLYAVEAVNKGRGWHVHLHVVVESRYVEQAQLAQDWEDVTGDSRVVDIREFRSGEEALRYALKYVTKKPECDGKEEEYNKALRGTRLVQSFGVWHGGVKVELPKYPCPDCGGTAWYAEREFVWWGKHWDWEPAYKEQNERPRGP